MSDIKKFKLWLYLRLKAKDKNIGVTSLPTVKSSAKIVIAKGNITWGKNNIIDEHVTVRAEKGEIVFGDDVRLKRFSVVTSRFGIVSLGNHCRVHDFTILQAGAGGIKIGDAVRIAPHVKIFAENHVFELTETPFYEQGMSSKGIIIGNNVWIGTGSIILDGVTIGDNVVIGAGSVVTRSVESNSIAAGNPAKFIRKL